MAQIITAPSIETPKFTSVFLAGGITNCKEWQKEVIKKLEFSDITLFNPRQEHFDVSDKNASYKQILWEFGRLEEMDIFSMYYCNDNSDQPICMYELGRNIVRMQNRFPSDWEKRIIISVEDGYRRTNDVLIQTELATQNKVFVETGATPDLYSQYILRAVRRIAINSSSMPTINKKPLIHCKDCKYFEYDSLAMVDGMPLIVAHEICKRWGDGCKTSENGYCFLAESEEEK